MGYSPFYLTSRLFVLFCLPLKDFYTSPDPASTSKCFPLIISGDNNFSYFHVNVFILTHKLSLAEFLTSLFNVFRPKLFSTFYPISLLCVFCFYLNNLPWRPGAQIEIHNI